MNNYVVYHGQDTKYVWYIKDLVNTFKWINLKTNTYGHKTTHNCAELKEEYDYHWAIQYEE